MKLLLGMSVINCYPKQCFPNKIIFYNQVTGAILMYSTFHNTIRSMAQHPYKREDGYFLFLSHLIFFFHQPPIHVRAPCSSPCFAIHGNVERIYRTGNSDPPPPSLSSQDGTLGNWGGNERPNISLRDQY
ncbi:hypothetical protein CDAR_173251 [Caerostris darwini]|uniref:Uncharacterized protein n=1 Tax=Caerostris darwini TaxID=1538125 RepID=A0AAV4WIY8_9ARAC|nr:hypothetical protein CDAR_173251 [Caerostris darwini]